MKRRHRILVEIITDRNQERKRKRRLNAEAGYIGSAVMRADRSPTAIEDIDTLLSIIEDMKSRENGVYDTNHQADATAARRVD